MYYLNLDIIWPKLTPWHDRLQESAHKYLLYYKAVRLIKCTVLCQNRDGVILLKFVEIIDCQDFKDNDSFKRVCTNAFIDELYNKMTICYQNKMDFKMFIDRGNV